MNKTIRTVFILAAALFFTFDGVGKMHTQPYTQTAQSCLAEAIFREAGGEPKRGQYAVGEVIMNRLRAGMAPTVCEVVHQKTGNHWQFGYNLTYHPIPQERVEYFNTVAQEVLAGTDGLTLPENVLYFNNLDFSPARYHLYCKIGHQKFYSKRPWKQGDIANMVITGNS